MQTRVFSSHWVCAIYVLANVHKILEVGKFLVPQQGMSRAGEYHAGRHAAVVIVGDERDAACMLHQIDIAAGDACHYAALSCLVGCFDKFA